MRRLVTAVAVLAACGAALVLMAASDESSDRKTYRIVFDNAFGLVEGGDFRVGGVRAGETTSFDVTKAKSGAPKAVVTAKVTEPGFGDFRRDATCSIRPQSLIGEYYVDCQPGSNRERLPDRTVPVEQTESTIPQDLVTDVLRRPYRERLRLIVTELGTGLAGRPKDLGEALRRAHPGLRETNKVLRILGDQNRVIEDFLVDADTVVGELERNKHEVTRWVDEAGTAAEVTAGRRAELRQTLRKLPGFLDELDPTMARLGEVADEQLPLLSDLRRAAPDLEELLTRLGPFADATRPALRSLGEAAAVGARAFREGSREVGELRRLARDAPATAKPLRQFLQTIDDRRRAIERDERAAATAPPAPDKTAVDAGRGFTGMEALWNYPFWQTLSLNGYDQVSHILRLGITLNKCSLYSNETDYSKHRKLFDDCNQWLGPNQPGITTPDFTAGPRARSAAREAGKPARRIGERRRAGQPDAGPLPGQRDISKPQVVLPRAVQNLLDRLQETAKKPVDPRSLLDRALRGGRSLPGQVGGALGGGDGRGSDNASQLLDFLLGP